MQAKINKVTVQVIHDTILSLTVDGIVVVTDPNLSVSPALLVAAGPTIEHETEQIGWCDIGKAVITDAGNLTQIKKIIHAVGPRWGEGSERGKLGNVTWESLSLAEANQLKSVALPAISAGALGYPLEGCASIMLSRIIDFTFENLSHLRLVKLCLNDENAFAVFQDEFQRQISDLQDAGEGHVHV